MVDALIGGVECPEHVGVHYFLLDACVTFLGWPALFPVPPRGGAAPTLMNYLVGASATRFQCCNSPVQVSAKKRLRASLNPLLCPGGPLHRHRTPSLSMLHLTQVV